MQSEVSEISPVLVEVKVEVPWDSVQKDLNAGFSKLARTAHVKGFRPGKVPLHVVKQLFRKQVHAEVMGTLIERGLMSAVEEHKIALVAQPAIEEDPAIKDGGPFEFKARIEVRPQIDAVDLDGIEIFRDVHPVADEQVAERIEQLRKQNADLQEPDPMRPAKVGDELVVDYEVAVDGEPKPEMTAEGRNAELGSGRLLPDFETGLIGMQPGETKEIPVAFPDDHGSEDLRGKTATFKVTVKELKERLLPEVDDEFAKDVGDYETLADLRSKLREELEGEAARRSELSMRDQIVNAIVEKNPIPVPPTLVQQQQQQMMREILMMMQMTGQPPGDVGELIENSAKRAERRVRAGLLLGAVARQEKIEVGEDEIEAKLAEIAASTGKHIAKVRVDYQGERRDTLESQLVEEKLMAMFKDRVTIKDGHPPEEPPPDEASSEEG